MTSSSPNDPITPSPTGSPDPQDVEKNKVFAVLAYIGILFLVPLLAAKESPFARYHTNQGLVLFLFGICGAVGCTVIGVIPFIGLITCLLFPMLVVCWFVFAILGVINAAQGKMAPLPLIGSIILMK